MNTSYPWRTDGSASGVISWPSFFGSSFPATCPPPPASSTKMTAPMERLQALDNIEKDIIGCLHNAGQALTELSKDKPSMKHVDGQTTAFLKTLSQVEGELSKQINYLTQVSTGQPHEGSSYASQKVLQMAWHRLEHARSRVNELERNKNQHLQSRGLMRAPPPPPPPPPPPTAPPPTTTQQQQQQMPFQPSNSTTNP